MSEKLRKEGQMDGKRQTGGRREKEWLERREGRKDLPLSAIDRPQREQEAETEKE